MNQIVKRMAQSSIPAIVIGFAAMSVPALAVDVARVNSKVITDRDVNAALANFNETQRRQILSDLNTRREVVNNIVDQELLIQEAEKQRLDKDKDYEAAFNAFRRQYLTDRVLSKNVAPKLSDAAAKKYFSANRRKYSTDKVQIQHILLSDEKSATDLLRQARAKGADFQALAEAHSKDPSAKNNRGDIGSITRDAPYVETFKDAAFDGAVGSVVGPVKTQFGYHLIKIVKKEPGKTLGFDEVEARVRGDLQREMVRNYVIQLKKGSNVSFDDKGISALR
jgi:peptidyl-prolyl cis-trans isomerase C